MTSVAIEDDPQGDTSREQVDAGILTPFWFGSGSRVLTVASSDLASELAARGADVVTVDRLGTNEAPFDVVIHRQRSDVVGEQVSLRDVITAAKDCLRPTGSLILAVPNPWGLRRILVGARHGTGPGRAGLAALLQEHGFAVERWLLPYPDHRAARVIVDTGLLDRPDGSTLARAFVREPVLPVGDGEVFVTDPQRSFQDAVEAGFAADLADAYLIVATRHGARDASVAREGMLWLVPPPGLSPSWHRPRELLDIGGRWLLHPVDTYEPIRSGPLAIMPATVEVPQGASGEDVVAGSLMRAGLDDTELSLAAWWAAAEQVLASSEPGQRQIDLRPRNFVVTDDGRWVFLAQDATYRFPVPPEVLALRAIALTISDAVLPRGWIPGLDPSLSVADAAAAVLRAIGLECGDEHRFLWLELEADVAYRMGPPGTTRDACRETARAIADEPLDSRLRRLPLARLLADGLAAPRLAAERAAIASELEEARRSTSAHADPAAGGPRSSVGSPAEDPPVPSFDSVDAYLEAAQRLDPWRATLEAIADREGIPWTGEPKVMTCCRHPVFFVPPDHYVKLYLDLADGHSSHAREVRGLRLAERAPDLTAPRIVGSGTLGDALRYIVISRIDGVPFTEVKASLPLSTVEAVAGWSGRYLRQLHAIPLDPRERDEAFDAQRRRIATLRDSAREDLERRGALPARLVEQVGSWLPTTDELAGSPGDVGVTHGSFRLKHVFVEQTDGDARPVGVIDFNGAGLGHPLADLCYAWADLRHEPPSVIRAFMREAALPGYGAPGFERTALAWAIIQRWPRAYEVPVTEDITSLDELAERVFGVARPDPPPVDGAHPEDARSEHPGVGRGTADAVIPAFASEEAYLAAIFRPEIWEPAVTEVRRREGLDDQGAFELKTSRRYPVMFLPPDRYLKLYFEHPWSLGRDAFEREQHGLRLAAEHDPGLPVPRSLGSGALAENAWYSLISQIPGVSLRSVKADLSASVMVALAGWAGDVLRRLHALPLDPVARASGAELFAARVAALHRSAVPELKKRAALPPHLIEQVDDWLPTPDEIIPPPERIVVAHGDYKFKHIFVVPDDDGARPSGIIDLTMRLADPMWDLCYIWGELRHETPRVIDAFMEAAAFPEAGGPDFHRRALAWALLQRWDKSYRLDGVETIASLDELAERAFGRIGARA